MNPVQLIFQQILLAISVWHAPLGALHIVSFNVLAPCWAHPQYYPPLAQPYLDRVQRRKHIIDFLNSHSERADIIALQETTKTEFNFIKKDLQKNFYAFQAYHDAHYWAAWGSSSLPAEQNGVALLVKKSVFKAVKFRDLALSKDGNHCAYVEAVYLGKKIRVASIHLDDDQEINRTLELNALLTFLNSESATSDIIAGDFNANTEDGALKVALVKNHFVDVLQALHHAEWTHPFSMDNDRNSGIIDHIVVRNARPIEGRVLSAKLWQKYPYDESGRIIANFQTYGSDHFPIVGAVSVKKLLYNF